ncbi:nitroreductase [Mycolicibacterium agri]|uniref:Nitroreductase n=1 Tax=Mycolicibacterium agri TaxID=36811 RepID=A0A2A7NBF4_MYCAG|nr:nitroreductase/quinone reductase family protein [Mycolicibacterium agri]PEG41149.1 nitroreductase [Mycolicibacterium agri]GFG55416.1 nitroreductase [Mycolicibacterium agri]
MPLHYVDPLQERGRWYRAQERFARSRPGQFVARHVFFHIDPWLFRVTGGRYPWVLGGNATAPLVSTGAKTGQRREHQLTYFHDGPTPILVASNSGQAKHPQWYHNLKAHPECELGDQPFTATEVTDPDEYARLFGLAEQVYAGYADYRVKTAASGRRIPLFRLTPR